MSLPPDMGVNFTATTHEKAEGSTLPAHNPPPYTPFNVVVTGAGKGLGRAISIAYAQSGVTGICISSRTQSDLDTLQRELLGINPSLNILSQICDTSDPSAVSSLATSTAKHFSNQIDAVIANAGVISKYLDDSSPTDRRLPQGIIEDDDFARVTAINYLGSYYTAKYFTPLLLLQTQQQQQKQQSPRREDSMRAFVVITSLAGHSQHSAFTPVAYNVSKLANNRMVEAMANDHGQQGLLAFAVHPGEVVTPQTQRHSVTKGDAWDSLLQTDVGLCGGFLTWLTRARRDWLSGRYVSVHWDVDELEAKKKEIVEGDKLKFRMVL